MPKKKNFGILVDTTYCLGCGVCVIACKQEHDLPPHLDDIPGTTGISWNQVLCFTEGNYPDLSVQYLPVHCMHCEKPPCIESCPNKAINKREDGIVYIDSLKCKAAKKCILACPYGAIRFNEEKHVSQACTLCMHRVNKGLEPACVRACIGGALVFGDLNDPDSKISQTLQLNKERAFLLKPEKGTKPSVWYISSKKSDITKLGNIDNGRIIFGSQI